MKRYTACKLFCEFAMENGMHFNTQTNNFPLFLSHRHAFCYRWGLWRSWRNSRWFVVFVRGAVACFEFSRSKCILSDISHKFYTFFARNIWIWLYFRLVFHHNVGIHATKRGRSIQYFYSLYKELFVLPFRDFCYVYLSRINCVSVQHTAQAMILSEHRLRCTCHGTQSLKSYRLPHEFNRILLIFARVHGLMRAMPNNILLHFALSYNWLCGSCTQHNKIWYQGSLCVNFTNIVKYRDGKLQFIERKSRKSLSLEASSPPWGLDFSPISITVCYKRWRI